MVRGVKRRFSTAGFVSECAGPDRVARAIAQQRIWAQLVRWGPMAGGVDLVAGADVGFSGDGKRCVAAIVVMDYRTFEVVEIGHAEMAVGFPYMPGLLSFRFFCPYLK